MRADGYVVEAGADGRVRREADTVRCAHCSAHTDVKATLGWCGRCGTVICARWEATKRCLPFEARVARASGQRPPS